MRDILFLAHRLPWPPDRGDKIRSHHLLRHLAGLARVHLVTFAEDIEEYRGTEALRPHLASLHIERRSMSRAVGVARALASGRPASVALFDSLTMRSAVMRLLAQEDIGTIFAFSGQMAQFVPTGCKPRFVMDFVDVDSQKFGAYAGKGPLPLRWLYGREARLLAKFEHDVAQRADASLFVSDAEAALFRALNPAVAEKVQAICNGIDLDTLRPDAGFLPLDPDQRGQGPLIVFTGQMDYVPNIEAVNEFAERVMPALRKANPDVRFAIVGRNPTPAVLKLAALDGVIVTGSVPDVRPWLAAANVVVAPLGIARGIQNKVLEAMAMARPVVASPAAAEGIDAVAGRDFVIADKSQMAVETLKLLDAPETAETIGRHARARMEERYRWDEQLKPLVALLGS